MQGGGIQRDTWASLVIDTNKNMLGYNLYNISGLHINANFALELSPGTLPGGAVRGHLAYDTTHDKLVVRDVTQARILTPALTIRKTANETVVNSNVLQNDNHLFFPVAANQVWTFLLWLRFLGELSTPVLHTNWTYPAAGTLARAVAYNGSSIEAGSLDQTEITFNTIQTYLCQLLYIGGANAGNIQLQWAQNVADANDLTVYANSFIVAHRLL